MTVYNFCAGPAKLPDEVMIKAQSEFRDWNNTGCSVMELSHRSKEYISVYDAAIEGVRKLLNLPEEYTVLFMHGGGRGQFSCVPLNLLNGGQATYVTTGSWSTAAIKEAQKYGSTTEITPVVEENGLKTVKPMQQWQIAEGQAYVHYCPNETVDGIEIFEQPSLNAPVVADMSSTIFSREIDIDKYGVIYAGAQKNIGPSGLSLVVIKKSLLERSSDSVPSIFNYQLTDSKDSMFNTPPTYAIYLAKLVFDWLLENGGISAVELKNKDKADLLYKTIDESDFYSNTIAAANRSRMNVPFYLANEELNSVFLEKAEQNGLVALKGHRMVGGMRASIYNAMPIEGVKALTDFMQEFERTYG